MPPRYAYWTILIDGKATAFRASQREELLPTFNQLARKNADIVMRYFARGRLWDTPEQALWANRNPAVERREPRDRAWRPGGEHKDPRARPVRAKKAGRPHGAGKAGWNDRAGEPGEASKPNWNDKSRGPGKPAWTDRAGQAGGAQPREQSRWTKKPWQDKPGAKPFQTQERRERPKWEEGAARTRGPGKPGWTGKAGGPSGTGKAAWTDRAGGTRPREQSRWTKKPWQGKPGAKPFQTQDRRERPKSNDKSEQKSGDQKDQREPRFDARPPKRPGGWSRPPKRKPR